MERPKGWPDAEIVDGMTITYPADWRRIPAAIWQGMKMTPSEYEQIRAERVERERQSPRIGEPAPDFTAERLSPTSERTGHSFRLSSARGRRVALVFGSYT
jgi:hypothetical protein